MASPPWERWESKSSDLQQCIDKIRFQGGDRYTLHYIYKEVTEDSPDYDEYFSTQYFNIFQQNIYSVTRYREVTEDSPDYDEYYDEETWGLLRGHNDQNMCHKQTLLPNADVFLKQFIFGTQSNNFLCVFSIDNNILFS